MSSYAHFNNPVLQQPIELAQYMSGDYRKQIKVLGMLQSVGATGRAGTVRLSAAGWRPDSYL